MQEIDFYIKAKKLVEKAAMEHLSEQTKHGDWDICKLGMGYELRVGEPNLLALEVGIVFAVNFGRTFREFSANTKWLSRVRKPLIRLDIWAGDDQHGSLTVIVKRIEGTLDILLRADPYLIRAYGFILDGVFAERTKILIEMSSKKKKKRPEKEVGWVKLGSNSPLQRE